MDNYNELEEYMVNKSENSELKVILLHNLSHNSMISVNSLIQLCTNCKKDYRNFIIYNPNLTIDDIVKYDLNYCDYAYGTIVMYYDIFSDNRITYINGSFYYNSHLLKMKHIKYNKYLTYELYKSKCEDILSNNEYICYNPNGNFMNYDFTDITMLVEHINRFRGIYNKKLEEVIIEYKSLVSNRIYEALRYLRYEFIFENIDLFTNNHVNIYNHSYMYKNKSLTIDNVIQIINNNNSNSVFFVCLFTNANITLEDIIINDLHKNEFFYNFASNRKCTVSDIMNNPELNWQDVNNYLSRNEHDYNNNFKYQFKFAD